MPIYSHTQLSTYEACPLMYKLQYRDRVEVEMETEGVEAFVGTTVHSVLQKCYDDIRLCKATSLEEMLSYFDSVWQKNWHDQIIINKKGFTPEHYYNHGKKMLEDFYRQHAPFNSDNTVQTEMQFSFAIGKQGKYQLQGYIDRLAITSDGTFWIHDYKTSGSLPDQKYLDNDRQLGLYNIGIQKKWPDVKNIKLVWHYLAFGKDLTSSRSPQEITRLEKEVTALIDEIEAAEEFPARESYLCGWCDYHNYCPLKKHIVMVEVLPVNEYREEPGVVLVNKYAELKKQEKELGAEIEKVKDALLEYACNNDMQVIQGNNHQVKVTTHQKWKFPGKNDEGREELEEIVLEAGKWKEVSQLDTTELTHILEEERWESDILDKIRKHGWYEDTSNVRLAKVKEIEE